MWMPVAGAVEDKLGHSSDGQDGEEKVEEYALPRHPALVLVSQCRQDFNKCEFSISKSQSRDRLTIISRVKTIVDLPKIGRH